MSGVPVSGAPVSGTTDLARERAKAFALIEAAKEPADLFGPGAGVGPGARAGTGPGADATASRRFRRLARLVHPDANRGTTGRRPPSPGWPTCGSGTRVAEPARPGTGRWSHGATSPTSTPPAAGCSS
jgi:hypothetical protein